MISIQGETLRVRFDRFGIEEYGLFLRTKKLPECAVAYDEATGHYELSAPSRYAPMLGVPIPALAGNALPLAGHLWDYERYIVETSLMARRFAVWADCGLGKTAMFLEWARQVLARTAGRVLIFSPRWEVIDQTVEEAARWYGDSLPIRIIKTRAELAAWCKGDVDKSGLAICMYHKLIDGILPELRYLAGVVCDESSLLKTGGGKIKWNLIKSAKGIEYKLSCTATPAPNDVVEYASQASFLEKLRSEGEILWTYFVRDDRGEWTVRPHARAAFFRFMASWSIYLRSPARFGWADNLASIPAPVIHEHRLKATPAQIAEAEKALKGSDEFLFNMSGLGVGERNRLNQIAKGFIYEGPKKNYRLIPSMKPGFTSDLIIQEVKAGRQTLVWTVYDAEAELLGMRLKGIPHVVLSGENDREERSEALAAFKSGSVPVLISKPALLGYGINLQNAGAMVFHGWNDSYEQWYQALRRAYRYGQTKALQVHVPFIPELEGMILENILAKKSRFETEATEMEQAYIHAMREMRQAA